MFDLEYFRIAPEIFYSFAKEIYPSNFKPSPSHMFIKLLENKDKLLRNYTQNIDTIESIAGIKKVLNCHGSFASSSCILCHTKYPGDFIKKEIFEQKVPYCPACLKKRSDDEGLIPPVIKPDIVFFGEDLPDEFDQSFIKDREELDLLIVMGSSLKVAPVSEIMNYLPANVPQILINRTPNYDAHFDVQLIGYSDTIVQILCDKLGWELPDTPREPIPEIEASFEDLIRLPHYWHRFPGAQLDPAEFLDIESEEDDWNQEVSSEMQEIDVISIAMESEHLDGTQGSNLPLNGNLNPNTSQSTNEQQEN
jgi:NAD-dependent SIR2 family protein deacetylase